MESPDYSSLYKDKTTAVLDKVSTFRIVKSWTRGGNLLDIACGTGYLLDYLGGGTGVDLNPELIRECRGRYPRNRFLVSNCYDIPLKSGQFDTVVMSMIIEHLDMPEKALEEARRLLRPGANLILVTPNRVDWFYKIFVKKDPTHVKEYTLKEITHLAGKFFDVEAVEFGSVSTRVPSWMTGLLKSDIILNCRK